MKLGLLIMPVFATTWGSIEKNWNQNCLWLEKCVLNLITTPNKPFYVFEIDKCSHWEHLDLFDTRRRASDRTQEVVPLPGRERGRKFLRVESVRFNKNAIRIRNSQPADTITFEVPPRTPASASLVIINISMRLASQIIPERWSRSLLICFSKELPNDFQNDLCSLAYLWNSKLASNFMSLRSADIGRRR